MTDIHLVADGEPAVDAKELLDLVRVFLLSKGYNVTEPSRGYKEFDVWYIHIEDDRKPPKVQT